MKVTRIDPHRPAWRGEAIGSDCGARDAGPPTICCTDYSKACPSTPRQDHGTKPALADRNQLGGLKAEIGAFVADYNQRRYHESLGNLTRANVYVGRGQTILTERERIKRQTIANRRLQHCQQAA